MRSATEAELVPLLVIWCSFLSIANFHFLAAVVSICFLSHGHLTRPCASTALEWSGRRGVFFECFLRYSIQLVVVVAVVVGGCVPRLSLLRCFT